MNQPKKVIYPSHLLEDMQIEETIFPDIESNMGVATLSHKIESNHILRIYHLLLDDENNTYEVVQELAAFTFEDRNELVSFIDDLPHVTGLGMLMLLNPLPQTPQNNTLIN